MRFNQQFIDFYEKVKQERGYLNDGAQDALDEYEDDYIMAKAQERAYQLQFQGPDEFPFGYYLGLATQEIKMEMGLTNEPT